MIGVNLLKHSLECFSGAVLFHFDGVLGESNPVGAITAIPRRSKLNIDSDWIAAGECFLQRFVKQFI